MEQKKTRVLQLLKSLPSESEDKIKEVVDAYLAENPPTSSGGVTIKNITIEEV